MRSGTISALAVNFHSKLLWCRFHTHIEIHKIFLISIAIFNLVFFLFNVGYYIPINVCVDIWLDTSKRTQQISSIYLVWGSIWNLPGITNQWLPFLLAWLGVCILFQWYLWSHMVHFLLSFNLKSTQYEQKYFNGKSSLFTYF